MAIYRGPKERIERRFNEPIFGKGKALKRKKNPPGQHGKVRKKKSVYGTQLLAKQKAKYIYGVLEKQFQNLFYKSVKKKGVTGEILMQLLEARLDNMVYRLGIAPTRRAARQLVSHRHITVNGAILNIASYSTQINDIIGVKEKSKSMNIITDSISTESHKSYGWLEWDKTKMIGKMISNPKREEIPENIHEQSIVELYSK